MKKKQLANQKAEIVAQNGIIVHKDTIIMVQEIALDKIVKTSKQERNRAFFKGALAGGGIAAILILVL